MEGYAYWNTWHVVVPLCQWPCNSNVVDCLHHYCSDVRSSYYHWCFYYKPPSNMHEKSNICQMGVHPSANPHTYKQIISSAANFYFPEIVIIENEMDECRSVVAIGLFRVHVFMRHYVVR